MIQSVIPPFTKFHYFFSIDEIYIAAFDQIRVLNKDPKKEVKIRWADNQEETISLTHLN